MDCSILKRRLAPQTVQDIFSVKVHGVLNGLHGSDWWQEVVHSNFFVLVLLVVFKEATDLVKAVGRQLLEIGQVTEFRIVDTNCNYLVIFLTLINHRHKANGPSTEKATRYHRLLHQHQYIHWISIFTQCAGYEPVVVRINH
uniref:Uncharacterized protein n=1 Tax=Arundo donax TaxID=35708 RepID=A0A0A9AEQ3_ARUDO